MSRDKRDERLNLLLESRSELPKDWRDRYGVQSRLELARKSRRVSQARLAQAIGISESVLRRLENRRAGRKVPIQVLARAARVLEVPVLSVIEDEYLVEPAQPGVPGELPSWRELGRLPGSRTYPLP